VGLVGLTLAGIARMAYAFLAESHHPQVAPSAREHLSRGQNPMPSTIVEPQHDHIARMTTPVRNTPV
jgi:hypothetical protein